MYRFKSIKYLATTGVITSLLFISALFSSWFFSWAISFTGGVSTLQLFDAIFIPFCVIFKGPMLLFAGSIAGTLFDLVSGLRIVTIPVTILIRVLMFFIIKLLTNKKWWSSFYSFLLAIIILMFGYPLYYVIIYHDRAIIINELITDVIQAGFAYVVSIPLYYYLCKIQLKSNDHFWNDSQFDYLKSKKKKLKKAIEGQENGNW